MRTCAKCKCEVGFLQGVNDNNKLYCRKCYKEPQLKIEQEIKEKEIATNQDLIKRDKEFVRSIYEKRKRVESLNFKEKLRVVDKSRECKKFC